jgi:hypothetical protein
MEEWRSAVQEFVSRIGPRELNREEARELQLLRIRPGLAGAIAGLIEKLLADDAGSRELYS